MKLKLEQTKRLRALRGILLCLFALAVLSCAASTSNAQSPQPASSPPAQEDAAVEPKRTQYRINLALDFDNRAFAGTEHVRWVNEDDRPATVLYFHLYANMRAPGAKPTPSTATTGAQQSAAGAPATGAIDEPHIEISEVRATQTGAMLLYALDDQGATLRVNLREPLSAGAATEIEIKFKGSVPEIDAEETGLVVHVLQQVGAALRSERETRRARDINFRCRGVMLLGTFYPVLAAREGDDWQRKVEMTVGDVLFTEAADYQVRVEAPSDVALYASAEESSEGGNGEAASVREFTGESLRNFALVAGRSLRAEQLQVGEVRVRSIFAPEHERVGRSVLDATANAVRVYTRRFGPMPYRTINVVDAPLVAGLGSAEFAGLGAIASAFYVDFDSALMRNLPEMIREQRASVEDSLEWTAAHVVAHQWWGAAVGNDPQSDPILDEALSNWSALLYYKEIHGEERAEAVMEDQLRGVYKVYRTFGGEDMAADRNAREYRNSFQYSAIVSSKGALMFAELRRLLGHEKFFRALSNYYNANMFEIAEMGDLRAAFIAEAPVLQRRAVSRTFNRWLSSKRGDEDIAPPDPQLAAALGLNPSMTRNSEGNRFARLGKFFWQQMTRIR